MKNKIIALTFVTTLTYALDMPPMPPMIPDVQKDIKTTQTKETKKSTMPSSCELIPPMVIFLPPPMEKELSNCKNQLHKPKKELVEKNLSKLLNKKIKVEKIEIVKKFNQLYKVTYNGGTILVNSSVDAFIQQ